VVAEESAAAINTQRLPHISPLKPQMEFAMNAKRPLIERKLVNEEQNLYTVPVEVFTKKGEHVQIEAVIQDIKPSAKPIGTAIFSHGAPGSHKDFKYITPTLEAANVRVIAVNFPGCGNTLQDEHLNHDNEERVQFVQQIVDGLQLDTNLVFIGHSRGSENAIKMAALNREKTLGVVALNPIGTRIHRGGRPMWVYKLLNWIWTPPQFRWFSNWLLHFVYTKYAKFKVFTGEACGVAMRLMCTLDYADAIPYIKKINEAPKLKTLLIYGGKDWLIEPEINHEFLEQFNGHTEVKSYEKDDDTKTIGNVQQALAEGNKCVGVLCKEQGHFLNKDRALLVAESIIYLMRNVEKEKNTV